MCYNLKCFYFLSSNSLSRYVTAHTLVDVHVGEYGWDLQNRNNRKKVKNEGKI